MTIPNDINPDNLRLKWTNKDGSPFVSKKEALNVFTNGEINHSWRETSGDLILCNNGFHTCITNELFLHTYCEKITNRLFIVEVKGKSLVSNDNKEIHEKVRFIQEIDTKRFNRIFEQFNNTQAELLKIYTRHSVRQLKNNLRVYNRSFNAAGEGVQDCIRYHREVELKVLKYNIWAISQLNNFKKSLTNVKG